MKNLFNSRNAFFHRKWCKSCAIFCPFSTHIVTDASKISKKPERHSREISKLALQEQLEFEGSKVIINSGNL